MGTPNRLHTCFRQPEVLYLSLLNEILHRARHVFDRHVGINAMLIEQVDPVSFKPLERSIGDFLDVFRTAIDACPLRSAFRIEFETELGRDRNLISYRSKTFANQ